METTDVAALQQIFGFSLNLKQHLFDFFISISKILFYYFFINCFSSVDQLCCSVCGMEVFGDNSCPSPCNTLGFLQKNNSLDEKGRLAGQKNLLSCDNSDRDARFRHTETDFSNLFARGELQPRRLPGDCTCFIRSSLISLNCF